MAYHLTGFNIFFLVSLSVARSSSVVRVALYFFLLLTSKSYYEEITMAILSGLQAVEPNMGAFIR